MSYRSADQVDAEKVHVRYNVERLASGSVFHPLDAEEILSEMINCSTAALARRREKNLDEGVPERGQAEE